MSLDLQQITPKLRIGRFLWLGMLPATGIVVAVSAVTLFAPDEFPHNFWHRSDIFWLRLVWFEAIILFAWFFGIVAPSNGLLSQRQQTGGGYPVLSAVVLNASVLSAIVLAISLFLPETRFFRILPIIVQLVIVAFCWVQAAFVCKAQELQRDEMESVPKVLKNPDQLCAFLTLCERQPDLDPLFARKLKIVRERLKYSVPTVGKVASSEKYERVVGHVEDAYERMMRGERREAEAAIDAIEPLLTIMITECKR